MSSEAVFITTAILCGTGLGIAIPVAVMVEESRRKWFTVIAGFSLAIAATLWQWA